MPYSRRTLLRHMKNLVLSRSLENHLFTGVFTAVPQGTMLSLKKNLNKKKKPLISAFRIRSKVLKRDACQENLFHSHKEPYAVGFPLIWSGMRPWRTSAPLRRTYNEPWRTSWFNLQRSIERKSRTLQWKTVVVVTRRRFLAEPMVL